MNKQNTYDARKQSTSELALLVLPLLADDLMALLPSTLDSDLRKYEGVTIFPRWCDRLAKQLHLVICLYVLCVMTTAHIRRPC